jgi:DNA-binding CsgD family transcriptional regulator
MYELKHYGMPRRSGRYPWGSGENPYQSAIGFLGVVEELRKQGLSEVEIARGLGITTSQLRARKTLSKEEVRAANVAQALTLQAKGMSNVAIGRRMGINESSVRSLLDPAKAERAAITQATSNMLRESIANYKYIDVGAGVENHIGVSRTKLNTAIAELKEQGYIMHYAKVEQLGFASGQQYTTVKVLCPPGTSYSELYRNQDKIHPITGRSDDLGRTYSDLGLRPVQNLPASRVMVRYNEDGGTLKDGVIELRRGVEDLDLGNARYAQVRVGVDGTHYMKGMAIYADKMPDGVDVIYNTNKHRGTPMLGPKDNTVMKNMEKNTDGTIDQDNPFGSTIGAQRGALNIVGSTSKIHEEGTWDSWSRNISSQILSKQTPSLAKQQLNLAFTLKKEEFNEIVALTNPAIKKMLLDKFADSCDSAAVHLKAAALPRQATKVLLPITEMKENEVYAPTFRDGESVVLIRHPHGGTFEIPQLTVNNKSPAAKRIMENAQDAIGINPKVAQRLSGADFDGDSVIVIPNNSGVVRTQPSIKSLQDFDHLEMYKAYPGMKPISESTRQLKMGEVSNLITDMTIRGASTDEISRAVKHSMVVIDAEKHNLNYKQSYIDNGIASLAEKYQGSARGGASTIVSQASSELRVPERTPGAYVGPVSAKTGKPTKLYIAPNTGEKLYTETGATYIQRSISPAAKRQYGIDPNASYKQTVTQLKKQGVSEGDIASLTREKVVAKTTKTSKMAEAKIDPVTGVLSIQGKRLSSGTIIESMYENHANQMKALANEARKESLATKPTAYSPSAKITYQQEVNTLSAKLNNAQKNQPLERQAQIIANAVVAKKIQANPGMNADDKKKVRTQALAEARARTGAGKTPIDITSKEWEAIQSGAVTNNTLIQILSNTNLDVVKQYATPRQQSAALSNSKITRAENMLASGFTQAEVAQALGVSVSLLIGELYK